MVARQEEYNLNRSINLNVSTEDGVVSIERDVYGQINIQ